MNKWLLKYSIKLLQRLMYFLLSFLNPCNHAVVRCSQCLDVLIVKYQRNHQNGYKIRYAKASPLENNNGYNNYKSKELKKVC